MIVDLIENAPRYRRLHTGFAEAFDFLARPGLADLAVGRHEIAGDRVYALLADEPGRRKEDARLEIHRAYIDIQWVLAGIDEMGWRPTALCAQPKGDYDRNRDLLFFDDAPQAWVPVGPGGFAVFFPEDAHMPLISSGRVRKVVVKVRVA